MRARGNGACVRQAGADGRDLPGHSPYVTGNAGDGLVIAILRSSMPGRALRFVQVPHMEIETTIGNGKADAAALVRSR